MATLKEFEDATIEDMVKEIAGYAGGMKPDEAANSLDAIKLMSPLVAASSAHRAANALESIAKSLEKIARPKKMAFQSGGGITFVPAED